MHAAYASASRAVRGDTDAFYKTGRMRDVIAGVIAVTLLLMAASLATTLKFYRRRRERARDSEGALGRTIIAEIPADDDLVLFSEDAKRFYYGDRSIDKDLIAAVHVLINGSPIASSFSRRQSQRSADRRQPVEPGDGASARPDRGARASESIIDDRPDGIARDRWDVAIESAAGTTLIQCGAIRERVSQELARAVFEAVKRDMERRDR